MGSASPEQRGRPATTGEPARQASQPPGLVLPLVLASASPRRRALLTAAGLEFSVAPADIDETVRPGLGPEAAAEDLALQKARVAAERWRGGDALVLGADTIVAVGADGVDLEFLAKPDDARDAARMLTRLAGSRHRVVTGVAVVRVAGARGSAARETGAVVGHERTWVTMRPLSPAEIDAYVASGEWRDKAGGYAIQETAETFVTRLEEGGLDNVVGLPVALACGLLAQLGRA